jgi:hypothetical protein
LGGWRVERREVQRIALGAEQKRQSAFFCRFAPAGGGTVARAMASGGACGRASGRWDGRQGHRHQAGHAVAPAGGGDFPCNVHVH